MSSSVSPSTFSSDLSDSGEKPRKLAILGLPWETSEDTLHVYFSRFGALEAVEILKDKYTGKSRGFGFVTFVDAAAADHALAAEHLIDGRKCEAKVAYPKGEPVAAKTRIFVARIPPTVTESQFRGYFEKFGKLQDAYMPKNHAKQGYRGIGFVTYASPQSVEKVMSTKHWMNGHEIALDKATPKDMEIPPSKQMRQIKLNSRNGVEGMMMNGNLVNMPMVNMLGGDSGVEPGSFEDRQDLGGNSGNGLQDVVDLQGSASLAAVAAAAAAAANGLRGPNALSLGLGLQANQAAALRELTKDVGNLSLASMDQVALAAQAALNQNAELNAQLLSQMRKGAASPYMRELLQLGQGQGQANGQVQNNANNGSRRTDGQKNYESPAIVNARAGPRLFIGKLTKETTEGDVKEYFQRFGYVMDVYLPKSKDNKSEHRGFGFVTFETEAAIQRVVAHGTHRVKGSAVAIDIAMPKVEDGEGSPTVAMSQAMAQKPAIPLHFDPLWVWPYMTPGTL